MKLPTIIFAAVSASLWLISAGPVEAYMGPGMGLGVIGAVLGVVGSILLGLVAIVWYPFKRLIRRLRGKSKPPADEDGGTP